MNQAGLDLVKHYEGFRTDAYLCPAGIVTIGYGHTGGVELGDCIRQKDAEQLLIAELEKFEAGLRCSGTENQLSAMTCLAYNIGIPAFSTSTVRRKHVQNDFRGAGEAFLLWDKATIAGKLMVLPGLVKRRMAEKALYLCP